MLKRSSLLFAAVFCFALVLVNARCGASNAPAGGPVTGDADAHCTPADAGVIANETLASSCHPGLDAGMDVPDYGDTLYNAKGSDDDCKYDLEWSSTPIRQNEDVTFTVTVTSRTGTKGAVGGGATYAEVFLDDKHPAPKSGTSTEGPTGTYKIGPVRFDAAGKWTVRFHVWGDCEDTLETSPHAHAAFFVNVP